MNKSLSRSDIGDVVRVLMNRAPGRVREPRTSVGDGEVWRDVARLATSRRVIRGGVSAVLGGATLLDSASQIRYVKCMSDQYSLHKAKSELSACVQRTPTLRSSSKERSPRIRTSTLLAFGDCP